MFIVASRGEIVKGAEKKFCPGKQNEPMQVHRLAYLIRQVSSSKLAPQLRQVIWILPLPLGTRSCWPQLGQRK